MLLSCRKSLIKFTSKSIEMLVALASGCLMGMTFAPVEAWYLAWVALAPLWYLLCRDRNAGTVIYPLCWGIGCYGLGLAWIFGIHPMTWMGVPYFASLAIATFCLTFITLWGGSLVVLWSIAIRFINTKPKLNPFVRVILATACWCGLETLYSQSDLWWTSLALSQSPHNLTILHLGQLSGPMAVSGSIVFVNGLLAEAFLAFHRNYKQTKPIQKIWQSAPYFNTAIASLVTLHLIGWTLANRPMVEPIESALKVGIIQGNIGNEVKLYRSGKNLAIENYTQGYLDLAAQGVDAIVTPESALPFTVSQLKNTPLYQAILDKKVTAFIGGFGDVTSAGYTNSMFEIGGDGRVISRYDKWKLVPLGEYVPFKEVIGKLVSRISPIESQVIPGKFAPTTSAPFGNVIFGICYDSTFAEHFRRQAQTGSLIITASNDAHYSEAMPAQHHAQDVMRAIETDRWAVRSSNTGYSAIIDPHGNTRWMSELNEFTTHVHQVYRQHTQNIYVRFGDWLTPSLLAIGLILFIREWRVGSRES
jgi:apolipoprotein N-acyltransferase